MAPYLHRQFAISLYISHRLTREARPVLCMGNRRIAGEFWRGNSESRGFSFRKCHTMRATPPRAQSFLRQIRIGGHYIKKSEPTSSRTPDCSRAACVVALTQKVRSDRLEPRHARSTARPALSPCRSSILIFLRGGFEKRNGAAKARGGVHCRQM